MSKNSKQQKDDADDLFDRILTVENVHKNVVGVCKVTLYDMISDGEFPPPVQISANRVGFRESDIKIWLQTRPVSSSIRPKPGKKLWQPPQMDAAAA